MHLHNRRTYYFISLLFIVFSHFSFATQNCALWKVAATHEKLRDNSAFYEELAKLQNEGKLTDKTFGELINKYANTPQRQLAGDKYTALKYDEDRRHLEHATEKVTKNTRQHVQREEFVHQYVKKTYTTPAQNEAWIDLASKSESGQLKSVKFLDVENSVMKKMNDLTNDKDLVTSLTNRHKELTISAIERLQEKNPGLVIHSYSDFKSMRFAFTGKIPANLEIQIKKEMEQVNKNFAQLIAEKKIVRASDKPQNWFRSGLGDTADQANLAARYARNFENSNDLQNFSNAAARADLDKSFQEVENGRKEVQSIFKNSGLLQNIADANSEEKYIPKSELFEYARKAKDSHELSKTLSKVYKLDIHPNQTQSLIDYIKNVDAYNPGIHIGKREFASLSNARQGGISTDFAGMGSKNLEGTAKALAKSDQLETAIRAARTEEKNVTTLFNQKKDNFQKEIHRYLEKKKKLATDITCSGDDCVVVISRNISIREKQELVQRLSGSDHPAGMRMAFVSEKVENANVRNEMASHGESIEKKLREYLRGELPQEKLDQILFSVDMRGGGVGQGSVRLITGNSRIRLTNLEREKIKKSFSEAVMDMNLKLEQKNVLHDYTAAP